MLRRLLIVAAVCAVAGTLGAPAFARPGGFPHTVSSQHFMVHYTSDPQSTAYATQTQATTLAALAERGYAAETGWGAPAPLDDGDGKVDIYVEDLSALNNVIAFATPDVAAATSTGYIVYGVAYLDDPKEAEYIAHELYHVIQYATWADPANADAWLYEGSAQWASATVNGFPADMVGDVPEQLSLDCRDSVGGFQKCDADPYVDGGYSRWPFFQLLAGRFGKTFVQSVLADGALGMDATSALQAAIAAKGATLADVVNDWAVAEMAGGYGITALDAHKPTASAQVATGVATATLPAVKVSVDHMAARYVKFTRGDGAADHACFAALLTVSVSIPSGVTSRPYFYWDQKGSQPVALTVSGNTATTSVPWDTCFWSGNEAYLALPNDTTSVDSADFVVNSSIVVDPTTPASATAAPSQGTIWGGQTNVPNAEVAPAITLFGPLLLQIPASAPQLRLIVESTDLGRVHAVLGSADLGTVSVRPGNNDLRFTIPKSLLSALRRSSANDANVLSLTPLSPSGAVAGAPVTRVVAVLPAAKKKK